MQQEIDIQLSPERIDLEPDEDRYSAGRFELIIKGKSITRGLDVHDGKIHDGPLISGYLVAEWLMWNLWRHIYEPEVTNHKEDDVSVDWHMSHSMLSIGHGYDWPNITIVSQGPLIQFRCEEPLTNEASSFKYQISDNYTVQKANFEKAVREFAQHVVSNLLENNIQDTNLQRLVKDIEYEAEDSNTRRYRQIEAILGHDPNELDFNLVNGFIENNEILGDNALFEIAAHFSTRNLDLNQLPNVDYFRQTALTHGMKIQPDKSPLLKLRDWLAHVDNELYSLDNISRLASLVRESLKVDIDEPIENEKVASLLNTSPSIFEEKYKDTLNMSYAMELGDENRVILASASETGMRFELVRLFCNQLMDDTAGFVISTQSNTYKQKIISAFATELLSPFEGIEAVIKNVESEEIVQIAASHFNVSKTEIYHQLRNHGSSSSESPVDSTGLKEKLHGS